MGYTSNTPLRGLSALMVMATAPSPSLAWSASSIPRATLLARVLNAPHDLHASIAMGG